MEDATWQTAVPSHTVIPSRTVACLAALGVSLLWLAQPPIAAAPLAWVAMIPWVLIVEDPRVMSRRSYAIIWVVASIYWALTMQGVRLAHPALYPGWILLGSYLGVYIPLIIGTSRVFVQSWRWPLWIGIPSAWAGWELVRSYAFTGFSAVLLGHSQVDFPLVTQIADLGGTYLISFFVAMVGTSFFVLLRSIPWMRTFARLPQGDKPFRIHWGAVGVVASLVGATFTYGFWRLNQAERLKNTTPLLNVALIQRDEPLVFTMDPQQESLVFNRYIESASAAAKAVPETDLFVWPESMYTGGLPYRILAPNWTLPQGVGMEREEFAGAIEEQRGYFLQRNRAIQEILTHSASQTDKPELLVGCSVYRYGDRAQAFGGALHIDASGEVAQWYGKRHLVMFGEYIPFGETFPWLYNVGPLRQGATPGDGPVVMEIKGVPVAPSICFETMVEHVTGNSLRDQSLRGAPPELMINLTNDAWFHGTAVLTHHQRCAQMVALINRRPLLVAANQGPTAWIDGSGRCVERIAYQTDQTLFAKPTRDHRWSLYQQTGDLVCWPFAFVAIMAWLSGVRNRMPQAVTRPPSDR